MHYPRVDVLRVVIPNMVAGISGLSKQCSATCSYWWEVKLKKDAEVSVTEGGISVSKTEFFMEKELSKINTDECVFLNLNLDSNFSFVTVQACEFCLHSNSLQAHCYIPP